MKKYEYSELVRYSDGFTKEKHDLFGELSPLDKDGTREFFSKYTAAMKKEYGEDCLERRAVSAEELEQGLSLLNKKEGLRFTAWKKHHSSGYKYWQLYTDRATVKGRTVILADGYTLPTAAAKCEFPKTPDKLTLKVYFDEKYRRPIPGGALITTPGKQIDLRAGITDAVRLFFAEDGALLVRYDTTGDVYHNQDYRLCDYPFDSEFEIELTLGETEYTVSAMGNAVTFPYLIGPRPDTLFLSGGLQPIDLWRVTVVSACKEGEEMDIFADDEDVYPEEKIGEVTLPYAIGTEKDADKELILRTVFKKEGALSYALRLEALDPHGILTVNGKTVLVTESFDPVTVSLDPYVTEGENSIELRIMPRAPELLYIWHRHRDPYNGWFSLSADLLCGTVIPEGRPTVRCLGDLVPEDISVSWKSALKGDASFRAYIRPSFPEQGEFTLVKEGFVEKGNLEFTFPCNYKLWSTEEPTLYEIKIELCDERGVLYTDLTETGFRIIKQRDGAFYLNGKRTVLYGALNMQFLPPYDLVPITHVCPSERDITEQLLALKNLNGNCLRLHQLGHGSSDRRFGEIADRLGVLLIWTTRAIDSAEQILWNRSDDEPWKLAEVYKRHMRPFLNHPSIIMWEGSNELHSGLTDLDRLYNTFVDAVKEVDDTRLICPVSHLYYGGGLYGGPEVDTDYYNNDGTRAADGEEVNASYGWLDESVVRSSHTYSLLLGYGSPWQDMVNQSWQWQDELFNAKDKGYIVSEFAIIGRQNPNTDGAREFINKDSYEIPNEIGSLGYAFTDSEWELGQAYQAICADMSIRQLRRFDADGMLWCALWSGANNGSYLKPPIDFSGYRKLAFYRMRDGYSHLLAANEEPDALLYRDYAIKPICSGLTAGKQYSLSVSVENERGETVDSKIYPDFTADGYIARQEEFSPALTEDGYYKIRYTLTEK